MQLTRRKFLKFTLAVLAGVTTPSIAKVKKYPDFNPKHQYGNYVTIYDDINKEILEDGKAVLIAQIKEVIPPQYREGHISFCYAHWERISALRPERTEIGWLYKSQKTKDKKMMVGIKPALESEPLTKRIVPSNPKLDRVIYELT